MILLPFDVKFRVYGFNISHAQYRHTILLTHIKIIIMKPTIMNRIKQHKNESRDEGIKKKKKKKNITHNMPIDTANKFFNNILDQCDSN